MVVMTYNLIISKEAPLALRRKIIKCVAHLHYFSFHLYFFPFPLSFFLSSLLFFKKFLWSSSLQNSIINFWELQNDLLALTKAAQLPTAYEWHFNNSNNSHQRECLVMPEVLCKPPCVIILVITILTVADRGGDKIMVSP